jgi:hypothetical protein
MDSAPMRIATGSSGSEKPCAAAGGSAMPSASARGHGPARHDQLLGGQGVDFQTPVQQRRARPVELGVAKRQPDTRVIRDGQLVQRGPGGQRAREAGDAHLAPGGRQVALDQAFQKAAALFGLVLCTAERGQQHNRGRGQICRDPSQNECPMPR